MPTYSFKSKTTYSKLKSLFAFLNRTKIGQIFRTENEMTFMLRNSEMQIEVQFKDLFQHFTLTVNEKINFPNNEFNVMIFNIIGCIIIYVNNSIIKVEKDELIQIPRSWKYTIEAQQESEILIVLFNHPLFITNKEILSQIDNQHSKVKISLKTFPVPKFLIEFNNYLISFIKREFSNEYFYELKFNELFLLVSICFKREELMTLFYYTLTESGYFKSVVLEEYKNAKNVVDLAKTLGVSMTTFNIKFTQEFGTTPGKWLTQQKAKEIYIRMYNPNIKIKDLINDFEFSSPTQFTRFCRNQFGMTPTQLLDSIHSTTADNKENYLIRNKTEIS
ncbi:MAG: AraC family transcriptional regulator [Bacteroidales bacterium]